MEAVHREISRLIRSFQEDDEPDMDGFLALNTTINENLHDLTHDSAKALWDQLEILRHEMSARQKNVQQELRELGPKRRAMKGYGHLRSERTGQRIAKRA
jgi:hypothetical protein